MLDLLLGKYSTLKAEQVNFIYGKVQAADASVFETEAAAKYTGAVWDKKSPINGVPAERIMELYNSPTEAYTINNGADIQVFQPFYGSEAKAELIAKMKETLAAMRSAYVEQKLLVLSETFFTELPPEPDVSAELAEIKAMLAAITAKLGI